MNSDELKRRAAELEDLIDSLPARHPDRVDAKDELRFIQKLLPKHSDPSKNASRRSRR
jgi:hypothetical protein